MPLHLAFCRPACRQHASYECLFSYTSKHAIIEAVIPASSGNEPLSMYSLHQKSISPMVVPLSVNLSSTAGTLNIRHHLPHTLESQSSVAPRNLPPAGERQAGRITDHAHLSSPVTSRKEPLGVLCNLLDGLGLGLVVELFDRGLTLEIVHGECRWHLQVG